MNRIQISSALATVAGSVSLFFTGTAPVRADTVISGISFADDRGTLYAPVRALADELGMPIHWDASKSEVFLANKSIPGEAQRTLFDGQRLVAVRAISDSIDGTIVHWDDASNTAIVSYEGRAARVGVGEKKVVVNLDAQRMRAYQGDLLVLDTPVSTGRSGHRTPEGRYNAGPLKTRMLISRSYNDAEMPYSVQIRGDYVIHGYTSVPDYPASHGCVRVPLTGGNPARWFYNWVSVGTPIVISDTWKAAPAQQPPGSDS